jgi:hypothetical protein
MCFSIVSYVPIVVKKFNRKGRKVFMQRTQRDFRYFPIYIKPQADEEATPWISSRGDELMI